MFRWTAEGLEFTNPGCFRAGVEQAYVGGTSDARNKTILKMSSLVQVGERAGSGVPNMADRWMSCGHGRPRLTEELGPEVPTVFLPFGSLTADSPARPSAVSVGSKGRAAPSARREAIVDYLSAHGESRSADIAQSIGLGPSRTNDLLRELAEGGVVEAMGGYRNRRYRLAD